MIRGLSPPLPDELLCTHTFIYNFETEQTKQADDPRGYH